MRGQNWITGLLLILLVVLAAYTATRQQQREAEIQKITTPGKVLYTRVGIIDPLDYTGPYGYYECTVKETIPKNVPVYFKKIADKEKILIYKYYDKLDTPTRRYLLAYDDGIGYSEGEEVIDDETWVKIRAKVPDPNTLKTKTYHITIPKKFFIVCQITRAFKHTGAMYKIRDDSSGIESVWWWEYNYEPPEQLFKYVDKIPYKGTALESKVKVEEEAQIKGNSMYPTIQPGDKLVLMQTHQRNIRQNDIIIFLQPYWMLDLSDPETIMDLTTAVSEEFWEQLPKGVTPGLPVVHRVIYAHHPDDPTAPSIFLTKGDNNEWPDGWILGNQLLAKVVAAITPDGKIKSFVN